MGNTVFTDLDVAKNSLKKNHFAHTATEDGQTKPARIENENEYLDGYAQIATFLCNKALFEAALTQVSSALWTAYRQFSDDTRNRFTRSLNQVAFTKGFTFQSRFTLDTTHSKPIGIKLVGNDPQLGFMLRNKLFWKDSMDLRHGEHTHSLQWLAIAQGLPRLSIPVDQLYAKSGNFRGRAKDDARGGRSQPIWGWLADCFPSDMKSLATMEFMNGETLESHSYRAPQLITDYLFKSAGGPIDGHFVSNYLFHRYKNRNWLTTRQEWTPAGSVTRVTSYYTGDPTSVRHGSEAAKTWKPSQNPDEQVQKARMLRDTQAYSETHSARTSSSYDVNFHGAPGVLSFHYGE